MRFRWIVLILVLLGIGWQRSAQARNLDIYFIDTEGGAATLIITPSGESTLIDCGNPGKRDAERIARVAKIAGIKAIDNLVITHWHLDHYGGVERLAQLLPIHHFYDRGIPDNADSDDPDHFPALIQAYKTASQGKSVTLNPGDEVKLKSAGSQTLRLLCLCARGEVLTGRDGASANPVAAQNTPMPADPSDNARSLGLLLRYGGFRFLDLGDLTWNIEYKLVGPVNKIGVIDVYQSTHHGLEISNNPVLIKSVRPTVAIFNNGPHKGGHPKVMATLHSLNSVQDIFQMHKNLNPDADNARPEYIANEEPEETCKGEFIKLSVASDSKTYTVTVGAKGKPRQYQTRLTAK